MRLAMVSRPLAESDLRLARQMGMTDGVTTVPGVTMAPEREQGPPLRYEDLVSAEVDDDQREATHDIEVRLTGIMERYMWTLNGQPFGHEDPIRVSYGDRIRIRFVNTTMMAHPMHLHGMFMELENGQTERKPRKHVVLVPPGKELSVVLTADEPGEWPFHCHLLYHMEAGMMTRFVVEQANASIETGGAS